MSDSRTGLAARVPLRNGAPSGSLCGDAELHLLDAGHWALETHLDEIVALARDFLGRVHA